MKTYTYEESVQLIRNQPEHSEIVKQSYLDKDNLAAAKRFTASEEFAEITKLLNLKNSSKKLNILDLGCGNGIVSYAFASLEHNVCSLDPDTNEDIGLGATSKLASQVENGSIKTYQGFAESLPFADSTFDIVYERQAIHHFSNLSEGLAECSRVLKPQGFFLATREHVVSNEKQLQVFLENHLLHKLHGGENAYTVDRYISNLKQSGLKLIKCFAPYDTVINHFPISNAEVRGWLFQALENKLGKFVASLLTKIPVIEKIYRSRLSRSCNSPGRLYSFLCTKGGK